jgi:hypothetical protein
MATLLSTMLMTNRRMGVALYFSAASLPLRLELVRSAAQIVAPRDKLATIEKYADEVRKRGRDRNKLVHCQWATSRDFPDGLIRTDPAIYHSAWIREYESVADKLDALDPSEPLPHDISVKVTDGAEIYHEDDFREILERLNSLFERIAVFMISWAEERLKQASEQ